MLDRYVGRHRKRRGWSRPVWPSGTAVLAAAAIAFVLLTPAELAVEASATGAPAGSAAAQETAVRVPPIPAHPPVQRFDILAGGDILIHSPIYREAATADGYDFRPMFAAIRPIVRQAALAICHVETPIGAAGPPSSYPIFNAPVQLARAIRWTGFDVCDTASNHTLDRGQGGVDDTLSALDGAGVAHAGSYRSRGGSRRILMLDVRGVRIAFLAYAYGTNGIPSPFPWSVNLISVPKMEADAARARRMGADLVIVNCHWGTEYDHAPNAQQFSVARTLLERGGIDAIIGQHAHVVQPIERLGGRFVVYGEGNLLSSQTPGCCGEGTQDGLLAVLHVRAAGGSARVTGVDYIPTWVEHPGYVVRPAAQRLRALIARGDGEGYPAGELRASFDRTITVAGRGPSIRPLLGPVKLG